MNIRSFLFLCLTTAFALTSCKKSSPAPKPAPVPIVDVYAVGYTGKNVTTATYWKNGVATQLTNANTPSMAYAIAINGSDVYIAGSINSANGYAVACYWKNGIVTKLTDSSAYAEAKAIVLSNNNIYVAGYMLGTAIYWKNGVATNLVSTQSAGTQATSIAVDGTDVYVGGFTWSFNYYYEAAYWKNGVVTMLPWASGYPYSYTYGIAVSANNVIAAGDVFDNSGTTLPGYWQSGSLNKLINPATTNGVAYTVIANGSDIFMAGDYKNFNGVPIAEYWKNGTVVDFTNGLAGTDAHAIAVTGNDVYVGGFSSGQFTPPNEVANGQAAYWKNGTLVQLSNVNSGVLGIALVVH